MSLPFEEVRWRLGDGGVWGASNAESGAEEMLAVGCRSLGARRNCFMTQIDW